MKKQIAITAAAFLIIALSTVSAHAGSARRHTIEGILIGTGVTLLGTAIAHSINHPDPVPAIHHRPDHRYPKYRKNHKKNKRGHWETRKIWVEPVYKTKWNPGHYNKRGRWVPGRYQEFMVAEGRWKKEKVWVRHGRRY